MDTRRVLKQLDADLPHMPAGVARQLVRQLTENLADIVAEQEGVKERRGSKPWSHVAAQHAQTAQKLVEFVLSEASTTAQPERAQLRLAPSPHTGRKHIMLGERVIVASLDAHLAATLVEALNSEQEHDQQATA